MKNIDVIRCPACVKMKPSKIVKKGRIFICTNDACRYTYKCSDEVLILVTNSGDTLNYYTSEERRERKNKPSQIFTS